MNLAVQPGQGLTQATVGSAPVGLKLAEAATVQGGAPLIQTEALPEAFLPPPVKLLTAEMSAKAWAELEHWQPEAEASPTESVKDLSGRVAALQNSVKHTVQDVTLRTELLAALEALAAERLELLLGGPLGDLTALLTGNQQEEAILAMQRSLLLLVLGRITPGKECWPDDFGGREGPSAVSDPGRGLLRYGSDRRVSASPMPEEQLAWSPDRPGPRASARELGVVLNYRAGSRTLKALFPKPLTLPDLEKLNAFARHFNRFGPVAAGNAHEVAGEEWLGVRVGIAWLEGQLFAAEPGVSRSAARVAQNTVEHQISTFIRQNAAVLKQASAAGAAGRERFAPLVQEDVFSTYRRLTAVFAQERDAKKAILDSVFYAASLWKRKRADPEHLKMTRYQTPLEEEEETRASEGGLRREGKKWLKEIKETWNQFVEDRRLGPELYLDLSRFPAQYSAWAYALTPEPDRYSVPKASLVTAAAWCGAGLTVALAVVVFLLSR